MSTFYLDLVGGNDSNDGTTYANRWLTFTSGATTARIAPGDVIRVIASPDPTLVGTCSWTNLSKTITLPGAVTANIDTGEVAWTASANVTSTADTTQYKENTKSSKHVIAAGFTTGLAAYKTLGLLTDYSAYKQVSFWIYNSAAVAASTLSIRLCTDTVGAVSVNTIAIPALPAVNQWTAITVDTGAALSSTINSVALYCDLDPGAVTIQLDNIIACKDSTSADSLSLTSLIGKIWNLNWVASTAYSLNDIRKPTSPNRNGYRYIVTTAGTTGSSEPTWATGLGNTTTITDGSVVWTLEGLEDTWYSIQNINGTTINLDQHTNNLGNSTSGGWVGATESVATYKRECIKPTTAMSSNATGQPWGAIQDSGTIGNYITFTGGWNRTDGSTQTGETWITGQNGFGIGYDNNGKSFLIFNNLNAVRLSKGINQQAAQKLFYYNCHLNNCSNAFSGAAASYGGYAQGLVTNNNTTGMANFPAGNFTIKAYTANNSSTLQSTTLSPGILNIIDFVGKNNAYSINTLASQNMNVYNSVFGNNALSDFNFGGASGTNIVFNNCLFGSFTEFGGQTVGQNQYVYSQKHDQTANNHYIATDGGSIISAVDQRHTASGISWKFRPTSTGRAVDYPLVLQIEAIAVKANALVTLNVWTYRDNTNINGVLLVRGGQIAGVLNDVSVTCSPSINTWTQSSSLTFTPTEAGVVSVEFQVYDGINTSNNFWIDDFTASQA